MGGWSSYSPPPEPKRDTVAEKVKEFYSIRDVSRRNSALLAAHHEAESKRVSLIQALLDEVGGQIKNGLEGIEIEMKLSVPQVPKNLEAKLNSFELTLDQQNRFLRVTKTSNHTGTNNYFGNEEEERFIAIKNSAGWHIKIKQPAEPYSLGISGEEFVLRRPESLKEHTGIVSEAEQKAGFPLLIEQFAKGKTSDTRYLGAITKEKATQYAIERSTGRVYSLTLSLCKTKGRDPLVQLEIEYAGYIPNFPNPKNIESEAKIVEDILALARHFQQYDLTPTVQTKFDWLVGKDLTKSESNPKKAQKKLEEKAAALSGDQVFFGESI